MAISRTTDTDDDGSGTVGTLHNNAWLQAIYAAIDADPAASTAITPIITGNTSATGQAYSVQSCHWIREGKLIILQGQVTLSTLGTIVGAVLIQLNSLPVGPSGNVPITMGFWSNMTTSIEWLGGYLSASNNQIVLQMRTSPGVNVQSLVQGDLSNTSNFVFGCAFATV